MPRSQKRDFDIVVVGAGNAALTAALAAQEGGAKVLVLEKATKELRGGNTRFTGGLYRFAYDGIKDVRPLIPKINDEVLGHKDIGRYSRKQYFDDLIRVTDGEVDPQLGHITVDKSLETMQWMTKQGMDWEFTSLWAVDMGGGMTKYTPGSLLQAKGKGIGITAMQFRIVEGKGIPIRYETKFLRLVEDSKGRIAGVVVRTPEGNETIGCGAVVLASGGFEANAEMRSRYLGGAWDRVKVRGTKYNTGEGLQAALDYGAKSVGHWGGCHATPISAEAPAMGDLALTDRTNRLSYLFGIMVNRNGKRFADEGEDFGQYTYAKTGGAILGQPGAIAYQIFDQKTVSMLEKRYETTKPVVAKTLKELAKAIKVDAATLEATVKEYNGAIQDRPFNPGILDGKGTRGIDPPKSNWALPLDKPPFVCYPTTCGITFTFGGLEINERGQVIDTEDNVIHGLYAVGEVTGKFFYHNYAGGAGLMRGAVFGKLAGEAAAAQVRKG